MACSHFAVLFTLLAPAADAQTLRRPSLMILTGQDARIIVSQLGVSRWADAGSEMYPGEALQSGSETVSFAVCSGDKAQGAVYVLPSHARLTVPSNSALPIPEAKPVGRLDFCEFPEVRSNPVATTLDEPKTRDASADPSAAQIAQLPPDRQVQLKAGLQQAQRLIETTAYSLIGHSTRAALFERNGFLDAALGELRIIRNNWGGATWTRDVIARLTEQRITQPDLDTDTRGDGGVSVTPLVSSGTLKGKTYALLIGISRYRNDAISALHFADKDAESFRDYLMSPRGGELASDQIELIRNEAATRERIEKAIGDLVRGKANHENTLIVFVAAHGAMLCTRASPDESAARISCDANAEQPFILTFDSDPSEGKTSGLSMAAFRNLVTARAREFGRVLVFVDVCHAGHIAALPPETHLSSDKLAPAFEGESGMLGILMGNSVARSLKDELTYERLSLGHGVFSYYTLLGLNQDVRPSDGKVYFDDLGLYVSGQVVKATGRKQRPAVLNPEGKLVAVDDATKKGILLSTPAGPDTELARGADSSSRSDLVLRMESALKEHRLLPGSGDNAFDLANQLRSAGTPAPFLQRLIDQLRVALEEQGQAVILKYLQGDQVPQLESDFLLGARSFQAALTLAPDAAFDESRYLFCQGRAHLFEKRYAASEHDLSMAISIDPERAYAFNGLGIAYLEQIHGGGTTFDSAIAAFQVAIRKAPYWAYPRHNLALTYAEAGRFDEAIREYQQARLFAPEYSYLPYNLGLLFQQINNYVDARQAYADALVLAEHDCSKDKRQTCPAVARVHTALGVLEELRNRKKQAAREYLLGLKADPGQIEAKHDLALLWSRSNKNAAKAEQMWREILESSPEYVPTLIAFSEYLRGTNRLEQALPLYESVVRLRPDYVPAIIGLAELRTRTGGAAIALSILQQKRKIAGLNPDYWLARARAHVARSELADARDDYAEALRLAETRSRRDVIRRESANLVPSGE